MTVRKCNIKHHRPVTHRIVDRSAVLSLYSWLVLPPYTVKTRGGRLGRIIEMSSCLATQHGRTLDLPSPHVLPSHTVKIKHEIPLESHKSYDKMCDSNRLPCCFTVMIFVLGANDHQFQVKICWLVGDETYIKPWIVQASLECKTLSNRAYCNYRADDVQFFSKLFRLWHALDLAQEWYQWWCNTLKWHPNPSMLHRTSYSWESACLPRDSQRTYCDMSGLWEKSYVEQLSHAAQEIHSLHQPISMQRLQENFEQKR